MSTDDFKLEKDPQTGGYSLKYGKSPDGQIHTTIRTGSSGASGDHDDDKN